ncbi:threonine--tRNA ligase [Striga asiatica]|uniref:Threonine--tRNA ligase n=1 Tax=Striga asiatica TaxID=4170 RepID=A0A5A7PS68_STRAF|nr:threonine--tRNA ligase [Striga asiatica]
MLNAFKLQVSKPARIRLSWEPDAAAVSSGVRRQSPRLPIRCRFASITVQSAEDVPSAAISATWLFCSAIPTLLAFKRAAESLEKLMDTTREELPDTMAAVRLSGMEISDLTMELSDLGQEITQGVRSSTRAVRLAEERLRRLTNTNPIVPVQDVGPTKPQTSDPTLARTARNMREGIVKGRAVIQMLFTITRYSKMLLKYLASRSKA